VQLTQFPDRVVANLKKYLYLIVNATRKMALFLSYMM